MRLRTQPLAIEHRRPGQRSRRGSALLMAFLMLMLLFAIVFQLWFSTNADLRVADNDVTTTTMDLAVESALQEVYDRLKTDGEASESSGSEGGGAPSTAAADPTGAGGGGGAAGGNQQPCDSQEDDWAKPQRTTINEIELRVVVQDEDSKLNVLTMLATDEEEADKAFDRVVRVIDLFRAGSTVDVSNSDAIRLAEEMREYLRQRQHSPMPKPRLLSDSEDQPDRSLALSFNEFGVLAHFDSSLFRDFRDDHGYVVHSLGSYLTVWSSLTSRKDQVASLGGGAGSGGGAGGGASNSSSNSGNQGNQGNASNSGNSGKSGAKSGGSTSQQNNSASQSGGSGSQQSSSGGSGGGGGGGGSSSSSSGYAVNVNTAPLAVLNGLGDDRVIPGRFWDSVLQYRNTEDEEAKAQQDPDAEPVLNEYGEEVVKHQVFDSLEKLRDVEGFDRLDAEAQAILNGLLTTQSQVFSVYVTARKATGNQDEFGGVLGRPRSGELKEDQKGQSLVRTVRSVVWRYKDGDNIRIIPIVRWEVLDYTPFELQDYPNEDR